MAPGFESIRCAVFQSPAQSHDASDNPLSILTTVADALRVAAQHGVDAVVFPELYLSGCSRRQLDRESYELNIVGNMCEEVNVACVIGYAEKVHESEIKQRGDPDAEQSIEDAYNSIAAFHADGSRAGNYRSVSTYDSVDTFRKGYPFVELMPIMLRLPKRQTPLESQREIKVGIISGSDIVSPEHCRYLVRCGAQAIFAASSFRDNDQDRGIVKYVIPSRALENQVPVALANMETSSKVELRGAEFLGSSSIISRDGKYLVSGPEEELGDMPFDEGYLLPCKDGTLYAADVGYSECAVTNEGGDRTFGTIQQSIDGWDLIPCMPEVAGAKRKKEKREKIGFGRPRANKTRRRS